MFGFGKLTVDNIIADIKLKAELLSVVAEAKHLEGEAHDDVVKVRTALANAARLERDRAKAVAKRFLDLVA